MLHHMAMTVVEQLLAVVQLRHRQQHTQFSLNYTGFIIIAICLWYGMVFSFIAVLFLKPT